MTTANNPMRTLTLLLALASATLAGAEPVRAAGNDDRSGRDETVERLLQLHNKERAAKGAGALAVNPRLQAAAQDYAEHLARTGTFSHTARGTPDDRVRDAGYKPRAIAENIAKGMRSPARAVDGWMHSPGHRKNLLNDRFREVGVGVAKDGKGKLVWVAVYGSR